MGINKVQFGNQTLIDLTNDTVTADTLRFGYTAHDRSGASITGTMRSMTKSVDDAPSGSLWTSVQADSSTQYINLSEGYNPSAVYARVFTMSGSSGTPTATKSSVVDHAVTVTPSVTSTTGYITGSTKTGTPVTVTASELASGTKSITENGTGIDVVGYATVDVNIAVTTVYTGSSAPSSSLGNDGDIYIQG